MVQRLVRGGNDDPFIRLLARHAAAPADEEARHVEPEPVSAAPAQEAERTCIARMLVQTHGNRRRGAAIVGHHLVRQRLGHVHRV